MTYKIVLTKIAKDMLGEIKDRRIQAKIARHIDKLSNNPDMQGKPLKGRFSGYRSVRAVGQRYRVVFKVEQERVVVYVLGVGIRRQGSKSDIYKRLEKLIKRS